jgi:hypothetical protein
MTTAAGRGGGNRPHTTRTAWAAGVNRKSPITTTMHVNKIFFMTFSSFRFLNRSRG